jgi:hypothetical protein
MGNRSGTQLTKEDKMTSRWIAFGVVLAIAYVTPASAAGVSPPNIPVEISIDTPAIDPGLGELIILGIRAKTGGQNYPGNDIGTRPQDEGERAVQGDLLILPPGTGSLRQPRIFDPVHSFIARPGVPGPDFSYLNRFRAYFSSASGGFGVRIGYDRKINSDLRLTAGTEMLTYGYPKAADILGAQLPANVTRITLISLPFGIQQQFGTENRVIPHVGLAAGPILRFDHHPTLAPGFYPTYADLRTRGTTLNFGISGNPFADYPTMSLTFGGFVETGTDIRLGEDRDFSLTLAGRYGLARFSDALGNPGDFSGFSLSLGFGKYF